MLPDTIRRVPAARSLARALRARWGDLRLLPAPRYLPRTPDTSGPSALEPYFPPTISTLAEAALAPATAEAVLAVLQKLTPTDETAGQILFYTWARARFGDRWRYADVTTVLAAAASLLAPTSYLEIGVRRGRSASVVASVAPECAIRGFDLWLQDYGGATNPGPEFVRGELAAAGFRGQAAFTSGDSAVTVPAFLAAHPGLFFDLINVDGDHSLAGAARDLANVLPRLKLGGVIVFDDIAATDDLARVWRWYVQEDGRYRSWQFTEAGTGIAAAIRVGQ
ncbi:MAG: class I SAM-dependent methyltransferase [Dehalococcoidia bacterium]|nr:class I SAM-dependent methyltransferase [Dehalococcoidia bacterium]